MVCRDRASLLQQSPIAPAPVCTCHVRHVRGRALCHRVPWRCLVTTWETPGPGILCRNSDFSVATENSLSPSPGILCRDREFSVVTELLRRATLLRHTCCVATQGLPALTIPVTTQSTVATQDLKELCHDLRHPACLGTLSQHKKTVSRHRTRRLCPCHARGLRSLGLSRDTRNPVVTPGWRNLVATDFLCHDRGPKMGSSSPWSSCTPNFFFPFLSNTP